MRDINNKALKIIKDLKITKKSSRITNRQKQWLFQTFTFQQDHKSLQPNGIFSE